MAKETPAPEAAQAAYVAAYKEKERVIGQQRVARAALASDQAEELKFYSAAIAYAAAAKAKADRAAAKAAAKHAAAEPQVTP